MIKNNYQWSLYGDSAVLKGTVYSLESFIKEIIELYSSDEVKFVFIDRKENDETGDTFSIHFVEGEATHEYECGATPKDVAQFLDNLAQEKQRHHKFEINKI